jgi:hypothetical protein
MPYFYKKDPYVCPACGAVLEWETRAVLSEHGDRMGLVHPVTTEPVPRDPTKTMPCPNAGKRFYAPGVDLDQIR